MNITPEELFIRVDEIIHQVLFGLEQELKILGDKHQNLQLRNDVEKGWMKQGGILIPLALVDHKILFNAYEYQLLDTFLLLLKAIYKEKESISTEFSFRTMIELGFFRTQILFSDKVSNEEKNRYKLLIWLADYSSMGIDHSEHARSFKKLLSEFGSLLDSSGKYYKKLVAMEKALDQKDVDSHSDLVPEIRKMINQVQGSLYDKTVLLSIFSKRKIKPIYSGWSHILHGNTLLISNMFSNKAKLNQHKLRVHWFMLLTGINVVTYIANYLAEPTLLNMTGNINKNGEEIMKVISKYWQSIEQQG